MNTTRSHVSTLPTVPTCGDVVEIVGTSDTSVDAAIEDGVARTVGPTGHLEWLEVTEVRSNVLGGVHRYRVGLRLGLRRAA